jgi:phosphoglycolate phosphatase-like HAD superfamily hydrolase
MRTDRYAMQPIRALAACALLFAAAIASAGSDPLPSWNDTAPKQAIVAFVERVTTPTSQDFIAPAERIAVFDNDGTLWSEQPLYFQAFFIFDRIKALAPAHPEWKTQEPFASVLKGDLKRALAGGERGFAEMMLAAQSGMTTEAFDRIVREWIGTARHPTTGRLLTEMAFKPMVELLGYLRANGFKTFIVSGGSIDFMRPWTQRVYGIPPEQVVGSRLKLQFEERNGQPVIDKLSEIDFVDDREGKPVGIEQHIGRRPVLAFGNSDGDFQMLEWTTSGKGPRLGLIVHHDDAAREFAYDRESDIGRLSRGLDEAKAKGWTVVSMRDDWRTVFP